MNFDFLIYDVIIGVIVILIVTLFYVFSRGVLKKLKIGNTKTRNFLAVIPTFVLSFIMIYFAVLLSLFLASYYPRHKFDIEEWNKNPEERYEMSE